MNLLEKSPSRTYPHLSIPYVVLEFPVAMSRLERIYKIGRFIGQHGKRLQFLEHKLNVRMNIVTEKSSKYFRYIVDQLKQQNTQYDTNALWILLTVKYSDQDKINIGDVKRTLKREWENMSVYIQAKQSSKAKLSQRNTLSVPYEEGDTRWKPKKQRNK
jgi:hypothetical protein